MPYGRLEFVPEGKISLKELQIFLACSTKVLHGIPTIRQALDIKIPNLNFEVSGLNPNIMETSMFLTYE